MTTAGSSPHASERYDRDFFSYEDERARTSAELVAPVVAAITGARSVVDVGCGTGQWLRAFEEHGVGDLLGLDTGSAPDDLMAIDPDFCRVVDLRTPPPLGRSFDLALCLEVAEHLPPSAGPRLVEYLCSLAPVALFSAAIPGQGGNDHLNEQWPSYWASLFARHGYVAVDALRPTFWENEGVAWFYRQNMLLFLRPEEQRSLVLDGLELLPAPPLPLVHPELYRAANGAAAEKSRDPDLDVRPPPPATGGDRASGLAPAPSASRYRVSSRGAGLTTWPGHAQQSVTTHEQPPRVTGNYTSVSISWPRPRAEDIRWLILRGRRRLRPLAWTIRHFPSRSKRHQPDGGDT